MTAPLPPTDPHDGDVVPHLAQILAHRLRGLVAGIEGFTDLLTETLSTPDQRDLALRIMEGTARIESILADLQLYGEPLEPVMLPVRVEELLSELLVPLSDEAVRRVTLCVPEEAGRILLNVDPYLIRQALLIMTQNALDATARGGAIELRVRIHEDDNLEFALWNEGVIAAADAARQPFQPFYTTKAHNLGVGLTIARRIAQLQGGSLELTLNSIDQGVQFSLLLPTSV